MNNIKSLVALILTILLTGGMCYGDDWPQFRGIDELLNRFEQQIQELKRINSSR